MGLIFKEKGIAFSGFEGTLLLEGKPAVGAKLIRTWDVFNQKGEDHALADEDGRFKFSPIEIAFRTPAFAPVDFLSHQNIDVIHEGKKYEIWAGGKLEKEAYREFNGKPINLTCELTEETRRIDLNVGFIVSNCHWNF